MLVIFNVCVIVTNIMFHIICIVHDTDVDLSHCTASRLHIRYKSKLLFSVCTQLLPRSEVLSVHLSISLCLATSSVSYYTSYSSLSLSRRDEVCPVASGRHFPAGRLLRLSQLRRRLQYCRHRRRRDSHHRQ